MIHWSDCVGQMESNVADTVIYVIKYPSNISLISRDIKKTHSLQYCGHLVWTTWNGETNWEFISNNDFVSVKITLKNTPLKWSDHNMPP